MLLALGTLFASSSLPAYYDINGTERRWKYHQKYHRSFSCPPCPRPAATAVLSSSLFSFFYKRKCNICNKCNNPPQWLIRCRGNLQSSCHICNASESLPVTGTKRPPPDCRITEFDGQTGDRCHLMPLRHSGHPPFGRRSSPAKTQEHVAYESVSTSEDQVATALLIDATSFRLAIAWTVVVEIPSSVAIARIDVRARSISMTCGAYRSLGFCPC